MRWQIGRARGDPKWLGLTAGVVAEAAKLDCSADLRSEFALLVVAQSFEGVAEREERAVVERDRFTFPARKQGERFAVGVVCADKQLFLLELAAHAACHLVAAEVDGVDGEGQAELRG